MQHEDSSDVLTRTTREPDSVLRYGDHADAILDVHLPGDHPSRWVDTARPLVVLLHGGFWRAKYDRVHTRPLAEALASEGVVVVTPEYRRVGGRDALAGGWPTTLEDVHAAMRSLPRLLDEVGVSVRRTTVVGHSAGGHLALWLANERCPIDRVVGLAPVGDLRAAAEAQTGDNAVQDLLGGSPSDVPERYAAADPALRLAEQPACEVVVVHGVDDTVVPVENSRGLKERHPHVDLITPERTGHFDVIDPLSAAWPVVRSAATEKPVRR